MIDVSGLDADSSHPGLDAFSVLLAARASFTSAGQLRYDSSTGLLSGNTDADSEAEFEILLASKPAHLVLDRDIRPVAHGIPPLPPLPTLPPPGPGPIVSGYDKTILADQPTLFLPLADAGRALQETDRMHADREGTYHHAVSPARMPNGDGAAGFDGLGSYFEFPDAPDLSVTKTGILTIEAWLRPDALIFPMQEGSGYLHWMGKGGTGRRSNARSDGMGSPDLRRQQHRHSLAREPDFRLRLQHGRRARHRLLFSGRHRAG